MAGTIKLDIKGTKCEEAEWIQLSDRSCSGHFWILYEVEGYKNGRISWPAEELAESEDLCSRKIVNFFMKDL